MGAICTVHYQSNAKIIYLEDILLESVIGLKRQQKIISICWRENSKGLLFLKKKSWNKWIKLASEDFPLGLRLDHKNVKAAKAAALTYTRKK